MQFSEIVARQADGWFIFKGHVPALVAFVIYLIAGNAEVNRGPFDLPEAESELTAGYHTEYSGMHFGLFYVAEFVNLFVVSGVAATIFLGDGCRCTSPAGRASMPPWTTSPASSGSSARRSSWCGC